MHGFVQKKCAPRNDTCFPIYNGYYWMVSWYHHGYGHASSFRLAWPKMGGGGGRELPSGRFPLPSVWSSMVAFHGGNMGHTQPSKSHGRWTSQQRLATGHLGLVNSLGTWFWPSAIWGNADPPDVWTLDVDLIAATGRAMLPNGTPAVGMIYLFDPLASIHE